MSSSLPPAVAHCRDARLNVDAVSSKPFGEAITHRRAQHRRGLRERGGNVVAVADEGNRAAAQAAEPFGQRQAVGQRLAGMLFVGQRVDDAQPRRGVGESLETRLRERADDRSGDPALEVAGDVGDGLAAAERNVFRRLDRVAAELADRNLERRARAQRRLLEEQRNVQALERLFVAPVRGARRLELGRSREARRSSAPGRSPVIDRNRVGTAGAMAILSAARFISPGGFAPPASIAVARGASTLRSSVRRPR